MLLDGLRRSISAILDRVVELDDDDLGALLKLVRWETHALLERPDLPRPAVETMPDDLVRAIANLRAVFKAT